MRIIPITKNKVEIMNKLRISIMLLISMIIILPSISGLYMGKGELCKGVFWEDGTPISGATVALDRDGDGIIDLSRTTSESGLACFSCLAYGTYYIYIDFEDDGIWETEAEVAILNAPLVAVTNNYPLIVWRPER